MAVFSSLSSFIKRHKRKLIFTATVSVSIYLLVNHFVIRKFRNFQQSLKQELFIKEQIKRRYLQTQNDCYLTILTLLPILTTPITQYLPVEMITQALKLKKNNSSAVSTNQEVSDSFLTTDNLNIHQQTSNSKEMLQYMNSSKTELWSLLKIKTITRTLSLMFNATGLLLLTRLQLNILARRAYLESAIVLAGGKLDKGETGDFYVMEQAYLSLSWWLLNHGWQHVSDTIELIVTKRFDGINARTELTIQQFDELLTDVIEQLFTQHYQDIMGSIFPMAYEDLTETLLNTNPGLIGELDIEDSVLLKLLNETSFLLNSDAFGDLLHKMIYCAKETLLDSIVVDLDPNFAYAVQDGARVLPNPKHFKLASVLAQLSVQCNVLCDSEIPDGYDNDEDTRASGNIYLNKLNDSEVLDEFSASIYSNFE